MKLSVRVPASDVAFLDDYVRRHGLRSRSVGVQAALAALRTMSLGDLYEAAWDDWAADQPAWETTVKDGLTDEAW